MAFGLRYSLAAASRLDGPAAASVATCISCGVRPVRPGRLPSAPVRSRRPRAASSACAARPPPSAPERTADCPCCNPLSGLARGRAGCRSRAVAAARRRPRADQRQDPARWPAASQQRIVDPLISCRTMPKARPCSPGPPLAASTGISRCRDSSPAASADLPMPASPSIRATRGTPAMASPASVASTASTRRRPTNTGERRRPGDCASGYPDAPRGHPGQPQRPCATLTRKRFGRAGGPTDLGQAAGHWTPPLLIRPRTGGSVAHTLTSCRPALRLGERCAPCCQRGLGVDQDSQPD
jgi:hypothetical protein